MSWQLDVQVLEGLPRLAWILDADRVESRARTLVGSHVETGPGWLVEGVWPGAFGSTFEASEAFFGSGVVAGADRLTLVPSRSLVDRVMVCEIGDRVLASNSLVALLARTGARLDPSHNYRSDSYAVLKGIDRYERRMPVLHPRVGHLTQLFYRNAVVDRAGVREVPPPPAPIFDDFEAYYDHLLQAIRGIVANATDRERTHRPALWTTISTGYDSVAIAAVVSEEGVSRAYTRHASSSSIPAWLSARAGGDDGTALGEQLGLEVRELDDGSPGEDELLYLAPNSAEPEIAFARLAADAAAEAGGAVVFTGYHGGGVWDVRVDPDDEPEAIKRKDTSGINLSEIRLEAGFVHVPVPFIGVRGQRSIARISRSEAMRPWSVGGDYDRPIPRRIAESRGIARSAFGYRKKAVIDWYPLPKSKRLREAFLEHLRETGGYGKGDIGLARIRYGIASARGIAARLGAGDLAERLGRPPELDLPYEMHTWALQESAARLRERLPPEWREDA